ncbi:GIP [Symbiodinium natans]|uniref:GIP protein n=1 Tax=Symbiodinium natans TaxID=878477 RepID=A0A812JLP4_9DINO|nr:GIP [Symbiodinium natans]
MSADAGDVPTTAPNAHERDRPRSRSYYAACGEDRAGEPTPSNEDEVEPRRRNLGGNPDGEVRDDGCKEDEWRWDRQSWGAWKPSSWWHAQKWDDDEWGDHKSWSRRDDPWSRSTSWTPDQNSNASYEATRAGGAGDLPRHPKADGGEGSGPVHDSPGRQCAWDGWKHFSRAGETGSQSSEEGYSVRQNPRPTEKLVVPSFSGEDEDVGNSARSYLRQIEAWKRMTLLPSKQQALVLYQSLSGKAWVAAEELDLNKLAQETGVSYLVGWVQERFLDLEVTRIGKAFSEFFRKLRRRPGQSIRDYNSEYDRLFARLREVGCALPEDCAAWLYVDRLQLDEPAELNLLASVGNTYSLQRLQKAAIIRDRGHRKPWEGGKGRRAHVANVTDHDQEPDSDHIESDDESMPEEVASAYVTYQNAKQKYKEQAKARGFHGTADERDGSKQGKGRDSDKEERIRVMKAKSFCSGCGRKGHWHRDAECPKNRNGLGTKEGIRDVGVCHHVPSEVFALRHHGSTLLGITDTACAKSVAGTSWLQQFTDNSSEKPKITKECEAFRFGTGKIHYSAFAVDLKFVMGGCILSLKTSIINGDVPLLISKPALAQLGMVYDVAANRAQFTRLGIQDFCLETTSSGHPAIPIVPAKAGDHGQEVQLNDFGSQRGEQYMAYVVSDTGDTPQDPPPVDSFHIFYDKKLEPEVKNILTQDRLCDLTFTSWWSRSALTSDFWIETDVAWFRIHVTPRRALFNPSKWKTNHSVQKDMLLTSLGEYRDSSTQPAISKMSKTELLSEASRLGLVVHRSWTAEEIKACIMEFRMDNAKGDAAAFMKSVTNLTMSQLKVKADSLGVVYTEKITKGNLLRLLRESVNTPDNELMKIGKFKGYEFQEIPNQYCEWASKEVKASQNPHVELVRLAKWWEAKQTVSYTGATRLEENSVVPYPTSSSAATSSAGDWSLLLDEENKSKATPKVSPKRRVTQQEADGMPVDQISKEHLEEIHLLEAKLAALKQKAGEKDGKAGDPFGSEPRNGADVMECCCGITGTRPGEEFCEGIPGENFVSGRHGPNTIMTLDHSAEVTRSDEGEAAARTAYEEGDFSFHRCLKVLQQTDLAQAINRRGTILGTKNGKVDYNLLGLFVHGGVHGVTNNTKNRPALSRYLNSFAKRHLPEGASWSSIAISRNCAIGLHHDYNNLRGSANHTIVLGDGVGGEIWIEDKDIDEKSAHDPSVEWKKNSSGHWIPGRKHIAHEKFVTFDPFLKHKTCDCEGERWCIVFHTVRSVEKAGTDTLKFLKNCKFQLPKKNSATKRRPEYPTSGSAPMKSTRKNIFSNAGKLSVLMATLIYVARSFMAESILPPAGRIHSPAVMFEMGGTSATEEAVLLGKDVYEPMEWSFFESEDGKKVAHDIVHGGYPRELRVNLPGRNNSDDLALIELMHCQLDNGDVVVLCGDEDDPLFSDKRYLEGCEIHEQRLSSGGEGDHGKRVLYKSKNKTKVQGEDRVYGVQVVSREQDDKPRGSKDLDGSGITFPDNTPSMISTALRRLHQNLGHPRKEDLLRHLRLAGCESEVLNQC